MKFAFLDTNVFLEYKRIDQIDWFSYLNKEQVTLILCSKVWSELEEKKQANKQRVKERAKNTIKYINDLLGINQSLKLKENILLDWYDDSPKNELYQSGSLNPIVADDCLIATILTYKEQFPERNVCLITEDGGLRRKAFSRGIEIHEPPMEDRLPDEPSEEEKELKELRRENEKLKALFPKLDLVFLSGKKEEKILATVEQPSLEERMAVMELDYPKIFPIKQPGGLSMFGYTKNEMDRYNEALELYYQARKENYPKELAHENFMRKVIKIQLKITNEGTTPARDVEILLTYQKQNLKFRTVLPKPPYKPQPPIHPKNGHSRWLDIVNSINSINDRSSVLVGRVRDQYLLTKEKSTEIKLVIGSEVKHGIDYSTVLDPFFVVFNEDDKISSFDLDYKIYASNTSEGKTGQLHFHI